MSELPKRVSNPGTMKAVSAQRAQPLPAQRPALTKDRLKSGAADSALNALSIFGELWDDFRSADRFFKYKAAVLAVWFALSITGVVVACPGASSSNEIGAHLVVAGEASAPIYMIKNSGAEAWRNVVVVANDRYRAAFAQIAPQGDITLTPKALTGPDGAPAPPKLRITSLEIQTAAGGTRLLQGGVPVR